MTKRLPCPHTVHAALMDIAARMILIELNEREIEESIARIHQLIGLVFAGRYDPHNEPEYREGTDARNPIDARQSGAGR